MTDTTPLTDLVFPIGDGPWKRIADRIDAMPPGHERTQAQIDLNAMLIERRVRAETPTLDALALAQLERFIDFTSDRPRYVTANGIRQEMPRRLWKDAWAVKDFILKETPDDNR